MKASASLFLHVLAFQCPRCETPVVEWVLSSLRSLESPDGTTFSVNCQCGWADRLLGAQARGHSVTHWTTSNDSEQEFGRVVESGANTINAV